MNQPLLRLLKIPLNRTLKLILFGVLLALIPNLGFGQNITGTVTGSDGGGLEGATISKKGTTTGTFSGSDGSYRIAATEGDVLIFSYIGYVSREMTVGGGTTINVTLEVDVTTLEEVVVTGYATEKKKDLLGAVGIMEMEKTKGNTNNNIMQTMQGRVAGVQVGLAGQPGQGASITIRGISTLGNNQPLYIVDGVPVQPFQGASNTPNTQATWGLSWLNPADIESVQILKDASSASIYGSRASNGVVIITTKQAKQGRSSITASVRFSTERIVNPWDLMTSEEKAINQWQAAVNDGGDPDNVGRYRYEWHYDPSLGPGIQGNGVPVLDRIIYPEWLDEADQLRPAGHPNSTWTGTEYGGSSLEAGTDWNDVIFQQGIVQDYNVTFDQATDKGGVHLSVNLFDHTGAVIHSGYQRISTRLNSNYKFLNGRVKIGENIGVTKGERQWSDDGFGGTVENLMRVMKPMLPVKTEDGRFAGPPGAGFDDRDNPAGLGFDNQDDRIHNVKAFGNVYVEAEILKGLTFRTNLGIDYDNIYTRDLFRTYSRGFLSNTTAELRLTQIHQTNLVFNNTLTYSKNFGGKHALNVLAGTEAVENQFRVFSASGKDFALENNDYFQLSAASGERTSAGSQTGFSLFSYFGKVNYTFADKYLTSVTIRRDGSSRFGLNNRFAVFPAASVGWRISEEEFLQGSKTFSNLKLRAAWGQTGNQDIENTARFALYQAVYAPQSTYLPWGSGCAQTLCLDAATAYDIGNNNTGILPSGFLATQTGNDDLKWETTTEINVGLDFGLWSDKITGSIELYQKQTTDILIRPSAIGHFGDGYSRWANGADMETRGWEVSLGYFSPLSGDFNYTISGVFSGYVDKITSLPEDLWASYPGNGTEDQNIIGHSPNAMFVYRVDGLIQSAEELAAAPAYPGIRVGAFKYADLDGDGMITPTDREYIDAAARALVDFGLNSQMNYKAFDLTIQLTGALGRLIPGDANYNELGGLAPGRTAGSASLNGWTFTNKDTHIPAQSTSTRPFGFSDWDVRSGDYLAIRQVTLGWNLPAAANSPFGSLRAYLTGENLHYFSVTNGSEASYLFGSLIERANGTRFGQRLPGNYPRPLRITLGIDVGF
ncbi:MAG: SusC/RagA family TonB-linked outer membrane protein [Bacteroidota bacterium]